MSRLDQQPIELTLALASCLGQVVRALATWFQRENLPPQPVDAIAIVGADTRVDGVDQPEQRAPP